MRTLLSALNTPEIGEIAEKTLSALSELSGYIVLLVLLVSNWVRVTLLLTTWETHDNFGHTEKWRGAPWRPSAGRPQLSGFIQLWITDPDDGNRSMNPWSAQKPKMASQQELEKPRIVGLHGNLAPVKTR